MSFLILLSRFGSFAGRFIHSNRLFRNTMFDLDNFSNVAITNGLLQILYVDKFDETNFASKRYVLREFNINDS